MASRNEAKTIEQLSELTFGIEIETQGISKPRAVEVIANVIGGQVDRYSYSCTAVAPDGRKWKAVSDGSIGNGAEVVSPILTYSDIPQLQEICRALRRNGATVDHRCGIHVHVGAQPFNAKSLGRLVSYWNRQELILQQMFNCRPGRFGHWARPVDAAFLAEVENRRPGNLDQLNRAWYGRHNPSPQHYDGTRYHGLNLHNVWYRGTIEFRTFDATLHAGKVKAYVQFCLAMANKALRGRWSQKSQNARREFDPATAKYDARTILLRLNLSGDEFKSCRLHLTKHLRGTSNNAGTNGRRDRREFQARQAAENGSNDNVAPMAAAASLV